MKKLKFEIIGLADDIGLLLPDDKKALKALIGTEVTFDRFADDGGTLWMCADNKTAHERFLIVKGS